MQTNTYVSYPESKSQYTEQFCKQKAKSNIETFIGTYTVIIKVTFSIFTTGIKTLVILWKHHLYFVLEVCCHG